MTRLRSLILFGAMAPLLGCADRESAPSGDRRGNGNRALVIGIDSADWTILDPLMAAGELPNLAALKARGAWGDLLTLDDIPLSPVVWTSIVTGKTPAKHGITWFLIDQPDGTRTPVRSSNRQSQALWNIVDRAGLRSNSVGWWASYPAEPLEHGIIASDALGFHGFGTAAVGTDPQLRVSPSKRFASLDACMPTEQQIGAQFAQRFLDISSQDYNVERFSPASGRAANVLNPIHLFQQYAVTAQGYTAMAETLLVEDSYELMLVYYEQVDSFSHLFMKYAPPKLPWVDRRGYARYGRAVHEWYRYQDELLGRLLQHVNLETTAVFVVSDHGFKSRERRIRSERVVDVSRAHLDHERTGIFLAAGPHIAQGAHIEGASVLDVAPTLLHYLGLPVGKDMDGRVLSGTWQTEFANGHPIRYVASHEPAQPRRDGPTDPVSDAEQSAQLEAGLRALGYLGEDDIETGPGIPDSSPEMLNNLGHVHLAAGDIEQAMEAFEGTLAIAPDNVPALLAMGQAHQLAGRSDQALHFFERALAANPNHPAAMVQLAMLRRDTGDLNSAARLFREALGLDSSDPSMYVGFGDVLQRAGNYPGALQAFQSALELDPDDFAAHYNLGVTYQAMGRAAEALAMYSAARKLGVAGERLALVLNNLGALQLEAGHTAEALAAFEEAAETAPQHLESRFNAAMIHAGEGRDEQAIAALRAAARLQPSHELIQLQLGLALLRQGEGAAAQRALFLVRRVNPDNWHAGLGLAALELAAGRQEEARALRSSALTSGGEGAEAFLLNFPELSQLRP